MQTTTATMQAMVQDRYGSSDQLSLAELPLPEVGSDEVLVEVRAAGIDRGVWHIMTGKPYLIRVTPYGGLSGPKKQVPGMDVAGRVAAIGDNVTRFTVGDEIFGIGSGTYVEYAIASESKLVHKPANISDEEAGVAAISGIAALQAITESGKLEAGQRVLVIGASGGVGSFAVQIAAALGGIVTGVAHESKVAFVRDLGVSDVIDYTTTDYLDGSRQWDLIIDTGGRNKVGKLRRALTPKGTLVIVGGEGANVTGVGRQLGAALLSPFVSERLTSLVSREKGEYIQQLADLMAQGSVKPALAAQYPLSATPQALKDLEEGRLRGKTAIVIDPNSAH